MAHNHPSLQSGWPMPFLNSVGTGHTIDIQTHRQNTHKVKISRFLYDILHQKTCSKNSYIIKNSLNSEKPQDSRRMAKILNAPRLLSGKTVAAFGKPCRYTCWNQHFVKYYKRRVRCARIRSSFVVFKVLKWRITKYFIYKTPYNFPNTFIQVNFIEGASFVCGAGIEPRASCILGKGPLTELHPQHPPPKGFKWRMNCLWEITTHRSLPMTVLLCFWLVKLCL